jgi:voltage-gated potassium channel
MSIDRIRRRLYEVLETASARDRVSRAFDMALTVLILANVLAVALGTVDSIQRQYGAALVSFEVFSVVVFTIEYVLRLWVAVEDPRYRRSVAGRLRYMVSWPAVVDLVAVLPFYLPVTGIDLRFVRLLRLLRLLRVLKLGRYSNSMQALIDVLSAKRSELWSSLTVLAILLFSAGGLMYYVENPGQPQVYSSIPQALWLSVQSFSGNSVATPITTIGRIISAAISVLSAGLFALPAAILASGFSERIQREIVEEYAGAIDDDEPSADRG